jgi:hypothetical protein
MWYNKENTLGMKTREDTMVKFCEVMVVPMLRYGSECRAMNKADRRAAEAVGGYICKD